MVRIISNRIYKTRTTGGSARVDHEAMKPFQLKKHWTLKNDTDTGFFWGGGRGEFQFYADIRYEWCILCPQHIGNII